MNRTQTYLGLAYANNPGAIFLNYPNTELTMRGMFIPWTGPYSYSNGERYQPYPYFMNLQIACDATRGDFYIGRGYPYPYDRGSAEVIGWGDSPGYANTPTFSQTSFVFRNSPLGPSLVEGCQGPPYTLPNRIQIYKMHIGALSNIGRITNPSSTWTLVTDTGGPLGYAFNWWPGGPSTQTPLIGPQINGGRDYGAVSFIRDGTILPLP